MRFAFYIWTLIGGFVFYANSTPVVYSIDTTRIPLGYGVFIHSLSRPRTFHLVLQIDSVSGDPTSTAGGASAPPPAQPISSAAACRSASGRKIDNRLAGHMYWCCAEERESGCSLASHSLASSFLNLRILTISRSTDTASSGLKARDFAVIIEESTACLRIHTTMLAYRCCAAIAITNQCQAPLGDFTTTDDQISPLKQHD
ncbi:hypothetical protein D9611_012564 [Ephemerocybe angulata]|uniref:Uncharacterized protein n=1 Tax=Ephemerocybe angulata TaxID=980116 RepID=A0A8H5AUQ5_9AGAR|nr:hypothetical protein D9611_012564 [Tulosesus angulatus]